MRISNDIRWPRNTGGQSRREQTNSADRNNSHVGHRIEFGGWERYQESRLGISNPPSRGFALDPLTATSKVADLSVRQSKTTGAMLIVTSETTYKNQHGKVVAKQTGQALFY